MSEAVTLFGVFSLLVVTVWLYVDTLLGGD